ncbi:hypothetical protein K501DRAFT_199138 [Backusella circina FSU 941]|nr:hypothetical protein K501DRAFT_199138 [Backusella circina FSU 941]
MGEESENDDKSDQISIESVPKVTVSEISEECSSISLEDDNEEEGGRNSPQKLKVSDLQIATHFENVRKSIDGTITDVQDIADQITLPPPGFAPNSADRNGTAIDGESSSASRTNDIPVIDIDLSNVKANTLNPRLQEDYDGDMLRGMQCFFNNKFSEAKTIFETKANDDPLYALGLGSMSFIKESALKTLGETYAFAHAQVDAASAKKPLKDTISHYFSNMMGSNPTSLPTNTRPLNKDELGSEHTFMSNGALRAHVIKAECSLLIAMIYLSQETVVGYIKSGLNLRRAYHCYSLVWQEYKRMGQDFNKYMDTNTISAIQFGIGSVHLLLSSLPEKVLKIISAFGWKADKNLGFAFLKLCLEGKRVRSPLASLMLLSYYTILTSYAPQILKKELIQPAIECLLDAQKSYPNSAFFLFFAGRVSRLARNLPLSTQSFIYACEMSQGDWAETTICPLATFEMVMNAAMGLEWSTACARLEELGRLKHNSRSFLRFFYGASQEMLGHRTEAILALAEAPDLSQDKKTQVDQFVANRVAFYEMSGYQDLDFSIPAFEILLTWNTFPSMPQPVLDQCIRKIDQTLNKIYDREKLEYDFRNTQLAPTSAIPDYYDQRGVLLLTKASILNALDQYAAGIIHLNWIIDNKEKFKYTKWLIPFTYWECGNTCWGTGDFEKARHLWETALSFSGYEFEYRLATRLNLAITHAAELGIPKLTKGSTPLRKKEQSVPVSKTLPPLPASAPESPVSS